MDMGLEETLYLLSQFWVVNRLGSERSIFQRFAFCLVEKPYSFAHWLQSGIARDRISTCQGRNWPVFSLLPDFHKLVLGSWSSISFLHPRAFPS